MEIVDFTVSKWSHFVISFYTILPSCFINWHKTTLFWSSSLCSRSPQQCTFAQTIGNHIQLNILCFAWTLLALRGRGSFCHWNRAEDRDEYRTGPVLNLRRTMPKKVLLQLSFLVAHGNQSTMFFLFSLNFIHVLELTAQCSANMSNVFL